MYVTLYTKIDHYVGIFLLELHIFGTFIKKMEQKSLNLLLPAYSQFPYTCIYIHYMHGYIYHIQYLTEPLVVEESAILTGEVTDCETLVSSTVFYLDMGFTDLNFVQGDWIRALWFSERGGRKGGRERERGRGEGEREGGREGERERRKEGGEGKRCIYQTLPLHFSVVINLASERRDWRARRGEA